MSLEYFHRNEASLMEQVIDIPFASFQRIQLEKGRIIEAGQGEDDHEENNLTYASFYIRKGSIEIINGSQKIIMVKDDFLTCSIKNSHVLRFLEDSEIYVFAEVKINDSVNPSFKYLNETSQTIQDYDGYTLEHCYRVGYYCLIMLGNLGLDISEGVIGNYGIVAKFHDIGKIKIPARILTKKGKLTEEEFKIVKNHPAYSFEILEPIIGEKLAKIALNHHERLDGSGYPNHLYAKDLDIPSRTIAVCDVFDAITSERSYHKKKSFEEAIQIMRTVEKDRLDQDLVTLLEKLIKNKVIDPEVIYEMPYEKKSEDN